MSNDDRECDDCGSLLVWVDDAELWRCYSCGAEVNDAEV